MNDFSEIESELKKLRPAPAGENLVARMEKALLEESSLPSAAVTAKQSSRANWISLGLGVGLAAAAGFLMLARVKDERAPTTQSTIAAAKQPNERNSSIAVPSRMVPAGLTEVVYHTRDEGIHFPEGSSAPVRRLRYHTRESLRWQNPQTGASLRVTYPSEEVLLVPVSGQ